MRYQETTEIHALPFSSKADTLELLSKYTDLNIPPLRSFRMQEWMVHREQTLAMLMEAFPETLLAIRSSCHKEDGLNSSGAGAFTSILGVASHNQDALTTAIEEVFASYGGADAGDQVLVQPMVENIVSSGVIMTRVHSDGAPYYVINYDDSGRADAITGGTTASKTVYIFHDAKEQHCDSERLWSLVQLARRVEGLCGRNDLDMEFCLDAAGLLHLLQVRPICTQGCWIQNSDEQVRTKINYVVDFVSERVGKWPELYGQRSILGVMPDWNPAEMIGIKPHVCWQHRCTVNLSPGEYGVRHGNLWGTVLCHLRS